MTPKQEKFIAEYVKSRDAKQAYKAAYNCENMSEENISIEAWRLLRNPKLAPMVKQCDKKARQLLNSKFNLTIEKWLKSVVAIAKDETVNTASRLHAYDMIGKHLGAYSANNHIESNIKINFCAPAPTRSLKAVND